MILLVTYQVPGLKGVAVIRGHGAIKSLEDTMIAMMILALRLSWQSGV
jgi:hypothetical protein